MVIHKSIKLIIFAYCISISAIACCMQPNLGQTIEIKAEDFAGLDTERSKECPLCLETFEDNDDVTKFNCACRIACHAQCLDTWRMQYRNNVKSNTDKCTNCDHTIPSNSRLQTFKYKDIKAIMDTEYKSPATIAREKLKAEQEAAAALARQRAEEAERFERYKAEQAALQAAELERVRLEQEARRKEEALRIERLRAEQAAIEAAKIERLKLEQEANRKAEEAKRLAHEKAQAQAKATALAIATPAISSKLSEKSPSPFISSLLLGLSSGIIVSSNELSNKQKALSITCLTASFLSMQQMFDFSNQKALYQRAKDNALKWIAGSSIGFIIPLLCKKFSRNI